MVQFKYEEFDNIISIIAKVATLLVGMNYLYGFIFCQFTYIQLGTTLPYDYTMYLYEGFFPLIAIFILCIIGMRFNSKKAIRPICYMTMSTVYLFLSFGLLCFSLATNNQSIILGTSIAGSIIFILTVNLSGRCFFNNMEIESVNDACNLIHGIICTFIISCLLIALYSRCVSDPMNLDISIVNINQQQIIQGNMQNKEDIALKIRIVVIDNGLIYGFQATDDGDNIPLILNADRVNEVIISDK